MTDLHKTNFSRDFNELTSAAHKKIRIDKTLDGTGAGKGGKKIITLTSAFDSAVPMDNTLNKVSGESTIMSLSTRNLGGYSAEFFVRGKVICYDWFCDDLYEINGEEITAKDKEDCIRILSVYVKTKVKKITRDIFDENMARFRKKNLAAEGMA